MASFRGLCDNYSMKKLLGLALIGLGFSAGLSSLPSACAAVILERLEASVNNAIILKSDLTKFRKTLGLRTQLDPLFAGTGLAAKGMASTDADIVDFLIDEKIILQAFPLSDAEVEQEINSIQSNNKISRDQLKSALQAQGYSFEDYFDLIRIGAAKRNLVDREIRTRVGISDEDIRNYYYNHYAKGKSVPSAHRVQIISSTSRKKIEDALAAIRAGQPFDEVAKKYSEDSTGETGGDLGELSEEQMSTAIRTELKKIPVGETSGVLGSAKTQFFLLKHVSMKSTDDAQLKKVSDDIRGVLASTEYQRQLGLWLERARQGAFVHRAGEPAVRGLQK